MKIARNSSYKFSSKRKEKKGIVECLDLHLVGHEDSESTVGLDWVKP